MMTTPYIPLMGDAFGGLVAVVEQPKNQCNTATQLVDKCYTALVRLGGPASTASWRYESRGYLDSPAQGPDGTIYVVEHTRNANIDRDKSVVVINGATGEVLRRMPLTNAVQTSNDYCGDVHVEYRPLTVGPIVARDGFSYLLVSRMKSNYVMDCAAWQRGDIGVYYTQYEQAHDVSFELLKLSRDGVVSTTPIDTSHHTTNWGAPTPKQLLPDGLGGLLIAAEYWTTPDGTNREKRITRFDEEGSRTDRAVPLGTRIELVGNTGTAYLNQLAQTSAITSIEKKAVDVTTWATKWTLPTNYSWVAAGPDGGAVVSELTQLSPYIPPYDQLTMFDGTGQPVESPFMYLTAPILNNGDFIGTSGGIMSMITGTYTDKTDFYAAYRRASTNSEVPSWQGNSSSQNASSVLPACTVFGLTIYGDVGEISVRQGPNVGFIGEVQWGVTIYPVVIGLLEVHEYFKEAFNPKDEYNMKPEIYPRTEGTSHGTRGNLRPGSVYKIFAEGHFLVAGLIPMVAEGTIACIVQ